MRAVKEGLIDFPVKFYEMAEGAVHVYVKMHSSSSARDI